MSEISESDTATRWNALHAIPHFSPRYPNEYVIRWTFRNFPRNRAAEFKLLDAGAGMGRHAIFWARDGYLAAATDVAPNAQSQIVEWASQENLPVTAKVAEADAQPFEDESFDGVLSFGVLMYLPYPRVMAAISEIWRVLKPGGRALVMVRSDADSRRRGAEPVDRWSYRVAPLEKGAYWESEVGMVMTFLDREALEECFAKFSEVMIERVSVTTQNGRFVDDDWHVHLRK